MHPDRRHAIALIPVAASLVAAPACSGDHSALAVDPNATSTSAVASGSGGNGGGSGGAGGSTAGVGGGGGGSEPVGPTKLTIVNGVVDYDAVRICFLAHPDTGQVAVPWPSDPTGLPFAAARVIDLASPVIPKNTDVRLHIIAGDLAAIAGKTCAEALALGEAGAGGGGGGGGSIAPPVTVAALAVIPASVFMSPKSLLLVPNGCLGGPSHTDPAEMTVCGSGYSAATPTAGLVAASMSRITTPDAIALQVAHASAGMGAVDVRITPGFDAAAERQLATKLTVGAVGPWPPFMELPLADYGPILQVRLRTFAPLGSVASSSIVMNDVFASSAIGPSELQDGKGFVLVAIGAGPGTAAGPWWHSFSYALIYADP